MAIRIPPLKYYFAAQFLTFLTLFFCRKYVGAHTLVLKLSHLPWYFVAVQKLLNRGGKGFALVVGQGKVGVTVEKEGVNIFPRIFYVIDDEQPSW
jgi:hypothetical protein